jgi:hypothetical protein
MKSKFFALVMALLATFIALLLLWQSRQPKVLGEIVWEAPPNSPRPELLASWFQSSRQKIISRALNPASSLPDLHSELVHDAVGKESLQVTWKGSTNLGDGIAFFQRIKMAPSSRYALVGEILYNSPGTTCRMDITTIRFYDTTKENRTIKEGRLVGESTLDVNPKQDWQPIILSVDQSKIDYNMAAFQVELECTGPVIIQLRNLKFIQYPGSGTPSFPINSSVEVTESSIWITASLFVLLLVLGSALFFAAKRRRRQERELRQMASHDS